MGYFDCTQHKFHHSVKKQEQSNKHSFMQNTIVKDTLREYVMRNEVVFQAFGDLVEVANEVV